MKNIGILDNAAPSFNYYGRISVTLITPRWPPYNNEDDEVMESKGGNLFTYDLTDDRWNIDEYIQFSL